MYITMVMCAVVQVGYCITLASCPGHEREEKKQTGTFLHLHALTSNKTLGSVDDLYTVFAGV